MDFTNGIDGFLWRLSQKGRSPFWMVENLLLRINEKLRECDLYRDKRRPLTAWEQWGILTP